MSHAKAVIKKTYKETVQAVKVLMIVAIFGTFIETILFFTKQEWVLPFWFGYGILFVLCAVLYETRKDWELIIFLWNETWKFMKLIKSVWNKVWEAFFNGKK
jgi:uncharacterized membrane protein